MHQEVRQDQGGPLLAHVVLNVLAACVGRRECPPPLLSSLQDRDVEVKKAISQEEMRRDGSRPSWGGGGRSGGGGGRGGGGQYGGRGDPYGGRQAMGGGGYRGDYRSMQPGYDAGGYGATPYYMGGGNYPMAGGYDRGAHPGYGSYDYYSGMYAGASGMGAYSQAASSYGPQRGYDSVRERDRGMMSGARSQSHQYHPYRR